MNQPCHKSIGILMPLLLALAACGGADGGGLASAPTAIASPSPAPSPGTVVSGGSLTSGVIAPESVSLRSDQPFVTFGLAETDTLKAGYDPDPYSKDKSSIVASAAGQQGSNVDFRFDPSTGTYSITFPDGTGGPLALIGLNGTVGRIASSTVHAVTGPQGAGVSVLLPTPSSQYSPYTYSHFGTWRKSVEAADGSAIQTFGLFAFGQEAPAAGIPQTGTARYSANIIATSPMDWWDVTGTADLVFDFGRGSLSGSMHPVFETNGFYTSSDYDYGVYDFAQTVYAAGSTRYSGLFSRAGTVLQDSWFEGALTGPNGQEVIGRFVAPFTRNGIDGALTGVWVGKRN